MASLSNIKISWDGSTDSSFLEDLDASRDTGAGLGAHLFVVRKLTSLTDQVTAIGAVSALTATIDQHPLLTGIVAVTLLAAISPASLLLLSDEEAHFMAVITKLQTGYVLDEGKTRALLRMEPLADRLIVLLCEKGLLRRGSDGVLHVQRRVLAGVRIGVL